MSREIPRSKPLLEPIATRYKPSEADFERVRMKIQTSLSTPTPRSALSSRTLRFTKWFGLSCVALLLVAVAAAPFRANSGTVTARSPAQAIASAKAHETPGPAVAERNDVHDAVPMISVDALPEASPRSAMAPAPTQPTAPSKASSDGGSVEPDDTLARETRLLSAAESAFRRGDDNGALAFLEEHAKLFPHGLLEDERVGERIIVLCHAGRGEQVANERRSFLRNRPPDPLSRRVVASCAGVPSEEPSDTP